MDNDGVRMVLDNGKPQLTLEHLHRYAFAAELCRGKRVLDAACGSGYGTNLLARTAASVTGVDICAEAVEDARRKYSGENATFVCSSIEKLPFPDSEFDVVVSFETIEHVPEEVQASFLSEVKRLLRPGGVLIMSTPDKHFYTEVTGFNNPFHVKEFYSDEFKAFVSGAFKNVRLFRQHAYPVSLLQGEERKYSEFVYDYFGRSCQPVSSFPPEMRFDYWVAVCSDSPIPDIDSSISVDKCMAVFGEFRGSGFELLQPSLQKAKDELAFAEARAKELKDELDLAKARAKEQKKELDSVKAKAKEELDLAPKDNEKTFTRAARQIMFLRNLKNRGIMLRWRRWTEFFSLRRSGAFEWSWYLLNNPDVKAAREKHPWAWMLTSRIPLLRLFASFVLHPLWHYIDFGEEENRSPAPGFVPYDFLKKLPNEQILSPHTLFTMYVNAGGIARATSLPKEILCKRIVVVIHEASATGAPRLAVAVIRKLLDFGYKVKVILLDSGPIVYEIMGLCDTDLIRKENQSDVELAGLARHLAAEGYRSAILNTSVSGCLAPFFKAAGIHTVTLIHEMQSTIETLGIRAKVNQVIADSDNLVLPSTLIADSWKAGGVEFPADRTVIMPQPDFHFDLRPVEDEDRESARADLRKELGIPNDAIVVLGCGTIEKRKAPDVFFQVASRLVALGRKVCFVWIGNVGDIAFVRKIEEQVTSLGDAARFLSNRNLNKYYWGGDVFFLSSTADPFPTVALLAAKCNLPVVYSEDATGVRDLFHGISCCGIERYSEEAFAANLERLVSEADLRREAGLACGRAYREKMPTFDKYVASLCDMGLGRLLPSVTAVLPNYNYAGYLCKRVESIIAQTYAVDELLVLDNNSTDDSDMVIKAHLPEWEKHFSKGVKYIRNTENKGVFRQWKRGMEEASGDLIWIAEADDLCSGLLMSKLVGFFADEKVVLAYAQSRVIDEFGTCHAENYRWYTDSLSKTKFLSDYVNPGTRELADCLAVKNTIPNASAVLFRKSAAMKLPFDKLFEFRAAGDWFVYIEMALMGRIAFCAETHNSHRRHSQSVIARMPEKTIRESQAIYKYVASRCTLPASTIGKMRDYMSELDPSFNFDELCFIKAKDQTAKHRIMIVLSEFHYGGGEIFPIWLANAITAKGNRVFVVSVDRSPRNADVVEMLDPSVELIGLPEIMAQGGLAKYIADNRIEAVSSHIWWSDKAAYSAVKDLPDVKWMFSMHGCYENLLANPEIDSDFKSIVKPMFDRANAIVYTADKNRDVIDAITGIDSGKIHKVNNGIMRGHPTPVAVNEYGISPSDKVLCFAARGIPEKGWKQVIDAIKSLNSGSGERRYHVFLIGAGDYVDRLKAQETAPELHFCGFQKDLASFIVASDALLLPTYYVSESQPMVIVEALAYGKPVVASDVGEIPYMIKDGDKVAGVIVPSGGHPVNVELLAEAIRDVCDNSHYSTYAKAAEELFARYDMDVCSSHYLDLLFGDKAK